MANTMSKGWHGVKCLGHIEVARGAIGGLRGGALLLGSGALGFAAGNDLFQEGQMTSHDLSCSADDQKLRSHGRALDTKEFHYVSQAIKGIVEFFAFLSF